MQGMENMKKKNLLACTVHSITFHSNPSNTSDKLPHH